jgi:hypothetical protein
MTKPVKDGVEADHWKRVSADNWREAVALGGENITYDCPNGVSISFGKRVYLKGWAHK